MLASFLGPLGRSRQAEYRDGSRFRAAIEANPAPGAVLSRITRGMDAIGTQLRRQFEAFGRAGFNAQPASFTLFDINRDVTACLCRHVHLVTAFANTCGRCSHLVSSQ